MATLPSEADLGALPSVRSGRGVGSGDVSAAGKAVAQVGVAVSNFGASIQKSWNANTDADVNSRYLKFKADEEQTLLDLQVNTPPDQAEGASQAYYEGYKHRSIAFLNTVPDGPLRRGYGDKLFADGVTNYDRAGTWELGAANVAGKQTATDTLEQSWKPRAKAIAEDTTLTFQQKSDALKVLEDEQGQHIDKLPGMDTGKRAETKRTLHGELQKEFLDNLPNEEKQYVATPPALVATPTPPEGMIQPGNLDIYNRPVLKNPDGTVSTTKSISVGIDGKEVLLPTVVDGKNLTESTDPEEIKNAAVEQYKKTGQHLGIFDTPEHADAYAETLHQKQADALKPKPPASGTPEGDAKLAKDLIKNGEGFVSKPGFDVDHLRLGYGSDTITRPDGTVVEVRSGMTVTREDAQRDLDRRFPALEAANKKIIGADYWDRLTPGMKAGLDNLGYNYKNGLNNGALRYVVAAARTGDPETLARAFEALPPASPDPKVAAALRARRFREAAVIRGKWTPPGDEGGGGTVPSAPPAPSSNWGTRLDAVPYDVKRQAAAQADKDLKTAAGVEQTQYVESLNRKIETVPTYGEPDIIADYVAGNIKEWKDASALITHVNSRDKEDKDYRTAAGRVYGDNFNPIPGVKEDQDAIDTVWKHDFKNGEGILDTAPSLPKPGQTETTAFQDGLSFINRFGMMPSQMRDALTKGMSVGDDTRRENAYAALDLLDKTHPGILPTLGVTGDAVQQLDHWQRVHESLSPEESAAVFNPLNPQHNKIYNEFFKQGQEEAQTVPFRWPGAVTVETDPVLNRKERDDFEALWPIAFAQANGNRDKAEQWVWDHLDKRYQLTFVGSDPHLVPTRPENYLPPDIQRGYGYLGDQVEQIAKTFGDPKATKWGIEPVPGETDAEIKRGDAPGYYIWFEANGVRDHLKLQNNPGVNAIYHFQTNGIVPAPPGTVDRPPARVPGVPGIVAPATKAAQPPPLDMRWFIAEEKKADTDPKAVLSEIDDLAVNGQIAPAVRETLKTRAEGALKAHPPFYDRHKAMIDGAFPLPKDDNSRTDPNEVWMKGDVLRQYDNWLTAHRGASEIDAEKFVRDYLIPNGARTAIRDLTETLDVPKYAGVPNGYFMTDAMLDMTKQRTADALIAGQITPDEAFHQKQLIDDWDFAFRKWKAAVPVPGSIGSDSYDPGKILPAQKAFTLPPTAGRAKGIEPATAMPPDKGPPPEPSILDRLGGAASWLFRPVNRDARQLPTIGRQPRGPQKTVNEPQPPPPPRSNPFLLPGERGAAPIVPQSSWSPLPGAVR